MENNRDTFSLIVGLIVIGERRDCYKKRNRKKRDLITIWPKENVSHEVVQVEKKFVVGQRGEPVDRRSQWRG